MLRLFLNADCLAIFIKLYNTVSSRISYIVAKDSCSAFSCCNSPKEFRKALSIKNIVTKDQCNAVWTNELIADDERICKSTRLFLNSITKTHAKLLTGSKKFLKHWKISWSWDYKHLSDTCKHQGWERIIDHWLVIHRHHLLGHRPCKRVKTCSRSARKDNSLHECTPFMSAYLLNTKYIND